MGVDLGPLVNPHQRRLEDLGGLSVAIDGYNTLYQFLASIRQPDGTPLMDLQGRITSHLSGAFYRTLRLLEARIRPVYVFDGKPPEFKEAELLRRREAREKAKEEAQEAYAEGEVEEAAKKSRQAIRLTSEMVEESLLLFRAMGIPAFRAPSEGEAEAAYLASKGYVDASGSQDYDSLLFGSPRLFRNLSITGRRKLPGRDEYREVHPEEILLEEVLEEHGISRRDLVVIGLLVGTDYNEGVKGIGPKKALALVKEKGADEVIDEYGLPKDVLGFFLSPPVEDFRPTWSSPDPTRIREILVEEHDFSEERVERALRRLEKAFSSARQGSLTDWL